MTPLVKPTLPLSVSSLPSKFSLTRLPLTSVLISIFLRLYPFPIVPFTQVFFKRPTKYTITSCFSTKETYDCPYRVISRFFSTVTLSFPKAFNTGTNPPSFLVRDFTVPSDDNPKTYQVDTQPTSHWQLSLRPRTSTYLHHTPRTLFH